MKLFIPELGTKLTLTRAHKFHIMYETRNKLMLATLNSDKIIAYDKKCEEFLTETDDNCWTNIHTSGEGIFKMRSRTWAPTAKYHQLSKELNDLHKELRANPFEISFPKGTILEVDRIYIRQGAKGFSSVTFKVRGKKVSRFWIPLDQVNKISFTA